MNSILYGIQIATLSGWLTCLSGYIVGFRVPQTWQLDFPKKPEAMKVFTQLDFALADPVSEEIINANADEVPTPADVTPPTEAPEVSVPEAPAPPPMPEIAASTALPDVPVMPAPVIRKVASSVAKPSMPSTPKKPTSTSTNRQSSNSNTPPARATTLRFGRDAGRQPAPAYPQQSRHANQQGTVTIEFIVGANGKVLSAWVSSPSPWPLLNNAALSTVRSRWSFPSGQARRYRIPIVFRLK